MIDLLDAAGRFIHEHGFMPLFCLFLIWRDVNRTRTEEKQREQIIAGLRVVLDALDAYDSGEDRRTLTPVPVDPRTNRSLPP